MKTLTKDEEAVLIQELIVELKGKIDGGHKNIVSACPYCGKPDKFGVFIGKEYANKKKFAANCFSCGMGGRDLAKWLKDIDRVDLIPAATTDIEAPVTRKSLLTKEDDTLEVDDELFIAELPEGYNRVYNSDYLEERGFEDDDYDFFEVGVSDNFKFKNYVIFPVIDEGDVVGYVSRHTWSKKKLDRYNKRAKRNDEFQLLRYKNSTDSVANDFVKLLYNIDSVINDETDTVVIVEGIFDVIALTRTLDLYENPHIAVVATFGKKISDTQIYKLQEKGVRNVVIGYDPDAVSTIKEISLKLDKYFNCLVADLNDADKDFDDLEFWEVFDIFSNNLISPIDYNMTKIQRGKLKI